MMCMINLFSSDFKDKLFPLAWLWARVYSQAVGNRLDYSFLIAV